MGKFETVESILSFAQSVFNDNESEGKGEQVPKALKLLEIVATEDLEAKKEERKFDSTKLEINIEELAPDDKVYQEEHDGFWDGGDDEDYYQCCFDYGGDHDLLFIGRITLSREAYHFLEDMVEEITKFSYQRMIKRYEH